MSMHTPSLVIDWDKIRSVDDVILPTPFKADADGNYPPRAQRLDHIEHGHRVVDARGVRFLLMGWGSVQGSVILRDRYRRLFHAYGDSMLVDVGRARTRRRRSS